MTEEDMDSSDIAHIKGLGLLEDDEHIYKFYSTYKNKVSGNFFTNKRVASYWLDENPKDMQKINTAYYYDIDSIDDVHHVGLTYSPYIKIKRKDNTSFKLYIDGNSDQLKSFYDDIMLLWEQSKINR
jgi:hypothetical protein